MIRLNSWNVSNTVRAKLLHLLWEIKKGVSSYNTLCLLYRAKYPNATTAFATITREYRRLVAEGIAEPIRKRG